MSPQPSPDELRSLLLEQRPGAPEPGLLAGLADVLPDSLLQYALLAVALGPRLPRRSMLRERVLSALAERVAADPDAHLPGMPPPLFQELARFLPRKSHERVLELAGEHGEDDRVAISRAVLAGDAPVEERPSLLREARAIWERTTWHQPWADVLEALAEPVPGAPDIDPAVAEAAARVAERLRPLPEREREEVLEPLVFALGDRLGGLGSAPPVAAPPPPPAAPPPPPARPPAAARRAPPPAVESPPSSRPERPPPAGRPGPRRRARAEAPGRDEAPAPATPERVVNSGFADLGRPETLRSPHRPLARDRGYWFCVEIGEPVRGAVEPERTRLPTEHLPEHAHLVVALFAFDGELEVDRDQDTAELELRPDGTVVVAKAAGLPAGAPRELTVRRLFFPVRTPPASGRLRLRCNIYCEGVLVQSRLVTARVARLPVPSRRALRARLEYSLSRAIRPALGSLPHHKLSLMLNGPGDGTHAFRVLGDDGTKRVKTDSHFDGQALTDLIGVARASLRHVAWGDEEEWEPRKAFRYGAPGVVDLDRLRGDLARLAVAGYRIYTTIVDGLRGSEGMEAFEEVMAEPGYVQLAAQDGRMLVPLGLVYDYAPFDDTAAFADYSLCETFAEALRGRVPLEELDCLAGRCPHRGADTVVCPSGFWGYRHFLGLPLSSTLDVAPVLDPDGSRRVVFGAASELDQVTEHEGALRPLAGTFSTAHSRRELLALLGTARPHLVYLYCHGGLEGTQPYLLVGSGDDGPLTRAFMFRRVSWTEPRPLVLVNGCHTTAVRPDQAFDLVSAFVQQANAAGVIGTEITVVESLARAFGEEFVRRFVVDGESLGRAVRGARLALLADGNPLGLVYVPFALAGLGMRAAV